MTDPTTRTESNANQPTTARIARAFEQREHIEPRETRHGASSVIQEFAAVAIAGAVGLGAIGFALVAAVGMNALQMRFTPNPYVVLPIALRPAEPMIEAEQYMRGRSLFVATCGVCHGPNGRGVAGLGKDITKSLFVCDMSDADLVRFLRTGREASDPLNTTKVAMPPSGGNPALTDQDMGAIVAFMRGLQDRRRVPDVPEMLPPSREAAGPPTDEARAAALAAAGGDEELAEYIAHGNMLFVSSCGSCHGRDAKGMPGLGKGLIDNAFVQANDEDGLLAFLLKGRDPNDPLNTTKVAMPPKGGNPALDEDDLLDIISYLQSLQPKKPDAAKPSS